MERTNPQGLEGDLSDASGVLGQSRLPTSVVDKSDLPPSQGGNILNPSQPSSSYSVHASDASRDDRSERTQDTSGRRDEHGDDPVVEQRATATETDSILGHTESETANARTPHSNITVTESEALGEKTVTVTEHVQKLGKTGTH